MRLLHEEEGITSRKNLKRKEIMAIAYSRTAKRNKEISKWLNGRKTLLKLLDLKAERLRSTHRLSSFGRLFGSTLDSIFSVGGFLLNEFQWGSWADGAFMISFSSGMVCLAVTLMEIMYLYDVDDELFEAIRKDQQNFESVQACILNDENTPEDAELHEALRIASEPVHVPEEEDDVFTFNPQDIWNPGALNKGLKKLIRKSSRNPIFLDIARIQCQLYFHPKNYLGIFSLSVRDLPEEQQRITSVPVSGRMLLNSMTAFRSFCNLRGEFVPKQYKKLLVVKEKVEEQTFGAHSTVMSFLVPVD